MAKHSFGFKANLTRATFGAVYAEAVSLHVSLFTCANYAHKAQWTTEYFSI